MLPGFRFLFAAILLSMSILIFGLGAAALLRAAHEEFASNPTWRAPPETVFAQQSEPNKTVLAALVVEPPAEPKKPETPVIAAPDQPPAVAAPPAEPEQLAAPKAEEASPRESAKSEAPAETPPASDSAPVQEKPADEAPAAATETKMAALEETPPPPSETAPAPPEQASAPAASEADKVATKIATLGGAPVAVEPPQPSKAESAAADKNAMKKRLRAQRARERRRIAAQRARLARQAALQLATGPFGLPATTATATNPPHIR